MDKIKALITTTLLCVNISLFSQELPVISSKADTKSIKVGEQINYELNLITDTLTFIKVEASKFSSPFEIIQEEDWDTLKLNNQFNFKKKFSLTSFEPGSFFLKSPKIFVNEVLFYSDSILIDVSNVKVDTVSKKFFDIKNIIEVKYIYLVSSLNKYVSTLHFYQYNLL